MAEQTRWVNMAEQTWTTSGYSSGRGAAITFYFTPTYDIATNRTKVVVRSYYVEWANNNAGGNYCEINGSFTIKSADTPSSSETLSVSLSKSGTNPHGSEEWNQTLYFDHDYTDDKSLVLSFSGNVQTGGYKPTINDSTTIHVATAPAGTVRIDNGVGFERYMMVIDNGESWDKYRAAVDNGTTWEKYS